MNARYPTLGAASACALFLLLPAYAAPTGEQVRADAAQHGEQKFKPAARRDALIGQARSLLARAKRLRSEYAARADRQMVLEVDQSIAELERAISRGAELDMVQLQTLVSQRQQAISLTENLLSRIHESSQAVVNNIAD